MKKLLIFLVCLLNVIWGFSQTLPSLGSEPIENEGILYKLKSSDISKRTATVEVCGKDARSSSDVKIPATFKKDISSITFTFTVVGVGSGAFTESLNSVTFPESETFTYINSKAFDYVGNSVTIPSNIAAITETNGQGLHVNAFDRFIKYVTLNSNGIASKNCNDGDKNLTAVFPNMTVLTLGPNVTYVGDRFCKDHKNLVTVSGNLKTVGHYAFDGCSSLKNMPSTIERVYEYAFRNCENLTGFKTENLTTVYTSAFEGCTSLSGKIEMPKLLGVSASAFKGCSKIETFICPELQYIGANAFENCTSFTNDDKTNPYSDIYKISFPKVHTVGSEAFKGCSSLRRISLPALLSDGLGDGAFSGCSRMFKVYDLGTANIAKNVFAGCSNLEYITTGASSVAIGAFADCSELTEVTINSNKLASCSYGSSNNLTHRFGNQVTIYHFSGDVTKIGDYALYKSNAKMVSVKDATTIGAYAFYMCKNLTSVYTGFGEPCSLDKIGTYAFFGCSELTKVAENVSGKMSKVDDYAFRDCSKLEKMPAATSVGQFAFAGCSFSNLDFSHAETIGQSAFYDCKDLEKVSFKKVVSIGNSAFENTKVTQVELPQTLTSLGTKAFPGVSNVTINCPKLLQDGVFTQTDNLLKCFGFKNDGSGSITIGDNVEKINSFAFYYDANNMLYLDSIHIGDKVKWMYSNAFYGLKARNKIYVGNSCEISKPSVIPMKMYSDNLVEIRGGWRVDTDNPNFEMEEGDNLHTIFGENVVEYRFNFDDQYTLGSTIGTGVFATTTPTALKRVTGSKIRYVRANAFKGCSSLETINLESTWFFDESAFEGCTGLRWLSIGGDKDVDPLGGNYLEINDNAFKNCTGISSIEIYYNGSDVEISPTAFVGVKPRLVVDYSGKVTVSPDGVKLYITDKEDNVNLLKQRGSELSTSIQRIKCEPSDVNMDNKTTGDDAQAVYNSMK